MIVVKNESTSLPASKAVLKTGMMGLEYEPTMILSNVGNHWPSATASCRRRLESSATLV
jgi:hypothetical protein